MDKTAVASPSGKNVIFTNHFPVMKDLSLRYTVSPSPDSLPDRYGTIILLQDKDNFVETDCDTISCLNARGFHVVTYDWHAQSRLKLDHGGTQASDFRFNRKILDAFFHTIVLPDFPSPFYILAEGAGGLFALNVHDILRKQIYRMVIVSPILEVAGHRANSLYHHYMRFISLISLNNDRKNYHANRNNSSLTDGTQQERKPIHKITWLKPQWHKMVLNAVAYVLSPAYCEHMVLPTLFIVPDHDPVSDPRLTREFARKLRMAESITIHGAGHNILNDKACYRNQFWKAFDTFIPGSCTLTSPSPDRR